MWKLSTQAERKAPPSTSRLRPRISTPSRGSPSKVPLYSWRRNGLSPMRRMRPRTGDSSASLSGSNQTREVPSHSPAREVMRSVASVAAAGGAHRVVRVMLPGLWQSLEGWNVGEVEVAVPVGVGGEEDLGTVRGEAGMDVDGLDVPGAAVAAQAAGAFKDALAIRSAAGGVAPAE